MHHHPQCNGCCYLLLSKQAKQASYASQQTVKPPDRAPRFCQIFMFVISKNPRNMSMEPQSMIVHIVQVSTWTMSTLEWCCVTTLFGILTNLEISQELSTVLSSSKQQSTTGEASFIRTKKNINTYILLLHYGVLRSALFHHSSLNYHCRIWIVQTSLQNVSCRKCLDCSGFTL